MGRPATNELGGGDAIQSLAVSEHRAILALPFKCSVLSTVLLREPEVRLVLLPNLSDEFDLRASQSDATALPA